MRASSAVRAVYGSNSRRFFVGGNWKANGSVAQVQGWVTGLNTATVASTTEVAVAAPSLYLQSVKGALRKDFAVAAQVSGGVEGGGGGQRVGGGGLEAGCRCQCPYICHTHPT